MKNSTFSVPNLVSHIHSTKDSFAINPNVELNKLIALGSAPQGMYHTLYLQRQPIDYNNLFLFETVLTPCPFCKLYIVNTYGDNPVGMLFSTKKEKTRFSAYRLFVGDLEEAEHFVPLNITDKLGILTYTSDKSVLFVISTMENVPFVVMDE